MIGRGPWRCRLAPPIRSFQCEWLIPGPWPVFLGGLDQALLYEARAGVALTQGLELGPMLSQLLREAPLRRNGGWPMGLQFISKTQPGLPVPVVQLPRIQVQSSCRACILILTRTF